MSLKNLSLKSLKSQQTSKNPKARIVWGMAVESRNWGELIPTIEDVF